MKWNTAILFVLISFLTQVSYGQWATEYTGKRIHLSSVKLVSESKKNLKVTLILSNTGRQDIRLYDGLNPETVVFTFGKTFEGQLTPYKERIIKKLASSNNTLIRAGQLFTPKSFKVKKFTKEDTTKVEPSMTAVEKLPEVNETTVDEPIIQHEEVAHTSPKQQKERVDQKVNQKKKVIKKEKESEKILSPIGELPRAEASKKCFDLVVEDLVVEKSTKRNVHLKFNLINYGEGVFRFDKKSSLHDNLSIKAFFASIPRLTRGALIVGGEHFDKMFEPKQFDLGFGEKIEGTLKLPLEKMTKFTPVVILELDPFSAVLECDKVNNVSTVLWKGN